MKKIAIIGSAGLLGSDLVKNLSAFFPITPISRDNYSKHVNKKFDVVINANGNSKRFWANQNPHEDFIASTDSVYRSVFDFPCDLYIYISSPDVYQDHSNQKYTIEDSEIDVTRLSPYGLNKYLSEQIVKKYKKKFLILRSAMMLGTDLRKGPLFDIINNKPVFVTLSSELQLITTKAIADIIVALIKQKVTNQIINMGGVGTFSFKKINKYLDKKIKLSPLAERQIYEMNVKKMKKIYPKLSTSEEYLLEFLKEIETQKSLI